MSMQMLHAMNGKRCACGKIHSFTGRIISGDGALAQLPQVLKDYRVQKAYLLCDLNTSEIANSLVLPLLDGFHRHCHMFRETAPEPNEHSVGSAVMHMPADCDIIIGIGSGVINDIGKILSNITGKKYIIVGTAPSMDGYASATSSMNMDGLKVSLNSRAADVIIGDTDILKTAPLHMLKSGIGDMLAKYVSIAEWRIAHLITGEYYCEQVADLIRKALDKCVSNAEDLMKREDKAIEAVFEGLVIGGIAMAYAGVSRPASGVEHYFSHIWDMRGLEFGT